MKRIAILTALALALIAGWQVVAEAQSHLLDGRKIRPGSIPAGVFAAASIDADDLAASSVGTSEVVDGSLAFADVDNTITVAGNPALAASECWFGTTGLVCEGATADAIETLLTFADPASADVTITVPGTTGTLISHAMFSGDATVSSAGVVAIGAGTVEFSMVDNSATIGADPAFAASEAWFGTTGLIFEGATADGFEGLLVTADITSSDKTWTLPDVTGSLVCTGDTGTVSATMLASSSVTPVKVAGLADTAATVRVRTPQQLMLEWDHADPDGNNDLTIAFPAGHAALITGVSNVCNTAEGEAATATLRTASTGGGSAISGAIDVNVTTVATVAPVWATAAVAASASVYLNFSLNPDTATACRLMLTYVHTD